jgi:hypothetical protein
MVVARCVLCERGGAYAVLTNLFALYIVTHFTIIGSIK